MKSLALLLPLALALVCTRTVSAQSLVSSADKLGGALSALSEVVKNKVDRDEGRGDALHVIDRAQGEARRVGQQASVGAGRDVLAGSVEALRDSIRKVQDQLARQREKRDSIRHALDDMNARTEQLKLAWSYYGFGPGPRGGGFNPPRGDGLNDRAAGIAARAVADNLRLPISALVVSRVDRDRDRAHVIVVAPRGTRYDVDVNTISGRVNSVIPIR